MRCRMEIVTGVYNNGYRLVGKNIILKIKGFCRSGRACKLKGIFSLNILVGSVFLSCGMLIYQFVKWYELGLEGFNFHLFNSFLLVRIRFIQFLLSIENYVPRLFGFKPFLKSQLLYY